MMRRLLLCSVISCMAFCSARSTSAVGGPDDKKAEGAKLVGAWELVSARYGDQDVDVAKIGVTLKHITPGRFVWLSYDADTKKVQRTAGGRWSFRDGKYVEVPEYGLGGDFEVTREHEQQFTVTVEGDVLHQTGTLSNGLSLDEHWKRAHDQ